MMPVEALENPRLARELAYYKGELAQLGERMARLNREVSDGLADATRARTLTNLLLSTSEIADFGGPETDVNEMLLAKIMNCTTSDRGVLFHSARIDASEQFTAIAAIGLPTAHPRALGLRRTPEFLFTTDLPHPGSGQAPSTDRIMATAELRAFIGTRHILWGYDPRGQVALLLGKHQELAVGNAFSREDSEFTGVALRMYRDVHHRRDAMFQKRGPAEAETLPAGPAKPVEKKLSPGIREAEIHEGIRRGGKVIGFLVVDRSTGATFEFVTYVRMSWSRHYQILRLTRGERERSYRDLALLVHNARFDFGFHAPVVIYAAGALELRRIEGILPRDLTPLEAQAEEGADMTGKPVGMFGLPARPGKPNETHA